MNGLGLHSLGFNDLNLSNLKCGQALAIQLPVNEFQVSQKKVINLALDFKRTKLSNETLLHADDVLLQSEKLRASDITHPMYLGSWRRTDYAPNALTNTKLSIAFSGWAHVDTALKQAQKIKKHLVGEQYIAFGGGDEHGSFNPCCVDAITQVIKKGDLQCSLQSASKNSVQDDSPRALQGYDGIAYCLQEGSAGLADALEYSFLVAKKQGFKVLLNCAYPFDFADADVLLSRLLANENIDIFSPQLYVTGLEKENNYSVVESILDYGGCRAALVPSLVSEYPASNVMSERLYTDAVTYFARKNIPLDGFLLSQ